MIKIVDYFFENIFISYWGAFLFIAIGIAIIKITTKYPKKHLYTISQGDIKGWAGGLSFIVLGIIIFVSKLLGKL